MDLALFWYMGAYLQTRDALRKTCEYIDERSALPDKEPADDGTSKEALRRSRLIDSVEETFNVCEEANVLPRRRSAQKSTPRPPPF